MEFIYTPQVFFFSFGRTESHHSKWPGFEVMIVKLRLEIGGLLFFVCLISNFFFSEDMELDEARLKDFLQKREKVTSPSFHLQSHVCLFPGIVEVDSAGTAFRSCSSTDHLVFPTLGRIRALWGHRHGV